jgi:hypothetical protein
MTEVEPWGEAFFTPSVHPAAATGSEATEAKKDLLEFMRTDSESET